MKKQFLLLLFLCLAAVQVWAERIDVATARKVAQTVASGGTDLRSSGELSLVYAAAPGQSGTTLRSGEAEGVADYFVFNFPSEKGFAIVAGDDRVRPVLGYSNEGVFCPDKLTEGLRGMLAYYQKQITWAIDNHQEASPDIVAEWNRYLSGTVLRSTEGKKLRTANWDQGEPYNNEIPLIRGEKVPVGCGATAAAIVMRYHRHPTHAENGVAFYYGKSLDYTPYRWEMMPLDYLGGYNEEEAQQVATLMWHIGANVKMSYSVGGSGSFATDVAEALRTVFGYSPAARYVHKSDYRWEVWKSMIRNEIDQDRPTLYRGTGPDGGHIFVLDGYDGQEAFRINWGWSGYNNGFYLLTSLTPGYSDFSEEMGMILDIKPKETGDKPVYALTYLALLSDPFSLGEKTSFTVSTRFKNTGSGTFKGYANIGVIDGNGKVTPISSDRFIDGLPVDHHFNNSWSFSCTLSKPLGDADKILPIYSLDGTNWKVMSGAAATPLYIGKNGAVEKEDEPNDPSEKPIVINCNWNEYDNSYLLVSGLDNNRYNYDNRKGVAFSVLNAKESLVVRYTLKEYDRWKDHLAIYTGDDYLGEPNAGTLVDVDENGAFEQSFDPSDFAEGGFIAYLKILSDQGGEAAFDIQVYEESNKEKVLFEKTGNAMRFVDKVQTRVNPNPIYGVINKKASFTYTVGKVDPQLRGKDFRLLLEFGKIDDQVKLYYTENGVDRPIELKENEWSPGYFNSEWIEAGTLSEGASYTFKVESANELKEVDYQVPSVGITLCLMNATWIPAESSYTRLFIGAAPIATHDVTYHLDGLSVEEEPTVVKDREGLGFGLRCLPGYSLPKEISITMGGVALKPGTDFYYDPTRDGFVSIYAVTGDVVITATGVKGEVVWYPVMTNLWNLLATPTIPAHVAAGADLVFTLVPDMGYMLPEIIRISQDGYLLEEGMRYMYDPETGKVKVEAVNGQIEIEASAVEVDNPTANEEIGSSEPRVWVADGRLHIQAPMADTAHIVTIDGKLYKTLTLPAREIVTAMPRGFYIIHIGDQSYKIHI